MVDLVKIRRKAKEQRDANGAEAPAQKAAEVAVIEPPAEPAVQPKPPRPARPKQRTAPAAEKKEAPAERPDLAGKQASSPVEAIAPASPAVAPPPPAPAAVAAATQPPAAADPRSISKLERFKQRAGRLRDDANIAGATAESDQQSIDESALELLTFAIAGEHYAMDIEHIVEIVPPRTPTRVPNAHSTIVGILSLRGTIVTLIDVRRRLRHPRTEVTPDTRIVVVDHHGETVGFEVDQVFRVVKIATSDVAAHPVVHASELDESIRGVFRQADALTILIDFDKLLDRREKARNGPVESAVSPA